MTEGASLKVLFVEDDPEAAALFMQRLTQEKNPSIEVEQVGTLQGALELLEKGGFDVILTDLNVSDSRGFETFEKLHARFPQIPIIVLTGSYEDEALGTRAVQFGAQDYLVKGEMEGQILPRVIRYAIERHRFREDLERRVAERTTQLEELNKELEAFTYSVSHDLRAPLRSITGFSQALLEDYGGHLDAKGKDYLERLGVESQRMDRLINDLLNLSRLTRGEIRRERVNLSAAAREIVARLKETQPARRVSLFISDGITAHGDPTLLRLVLENLLGNAWKFTGKRSGAKIVFGATRQEGKTVYFVRDDGAGFDPTYSGKLFTAFQRLHSEAEFPGTGIGLATVQRIVRRHGGLIWAEGTVGKGATFYFTLEAMGSNSKGG